MAQGLFEYGSSGRKKKSSGGMWSSSGKSVLLSAKGMSQEDIQKEEEQKAKDALKKKAQSAATQKKGGKNVIQKLSDLNKASDDFAKKYDIFGGVRKTASSVKALTGHYDRVQADLDRKLKDKKIDRKTYQKELQKIQDEINWAGNGKDGKNRLKTAAGVSLQTVSEVAPVGASAKGAKLSTKIAKNAAAGAGMAGMGSVGAQLVNDGKVDFKKTLADLAVGGIIGGAVPAVGAAGRKVLKKASDKIPIVSADNEGLKIRSMAQDNSKKISRLDQLKKDLIDRNAPVKDLVKQAEKQLGRKLRPGEDPSELLKLRGGVEGQSVMHLNDTAEWMKSVPKEIRQDGDLYGYSKQMLSQADKRTPEQLAAAQKTLTQLEQKYGGDLSQLDDYTQKTRQTFDSLIDIYEKEGIIAPERARMLRDNPNYFAKMEVIQDETANMFGKSSVNVRDTAALKKIKGMSNDAAIAPSAESYVQQTTRTLNDVASNRVGSSLGKLADELGDNDLIKRLRSTSDVEFRQQKAKFLAETRPGKQAVESLLRKHSKQLRKLTSELDRLNKEGLDIRLSQQAKETDKPILSGVRDKVTNVQTVEGKPIKTDRGQSANIVGNKSDKLTLDRISTALTGTVQTDQFSRKLTAKETRNLVGSLVSEDPAKLRKIRAMIERRDPKYKALFDEVENLRDELDGFNTARSQAFQEMRSASDKALPKGYTRISYMENGIRNEIAVPKEVGDVLTGADDVSFGIVTSTIGKFHNVFRQAVTTYNPLFVFLRNPIRDFKAFLTNSRYVPVRRAAVDYGTALMDSLTNGQWTKDFIRSGGGQAGYFSREGGQFGKSIARTAKEITQESSKLGKVVKSPATFMQKMSEAIEQAPRVAEYRAALRQGMTPEEAAIAGREVTVDFAQGGKFAKEANQWIPFLNARAQGTRRIVQAFRENPKRAAMVYAATGLVPMASLVAWNSSNYPETWASIPDYEKENNFIFVYGSGKNDFIKMPKGDVDKVLGNTFETMLGQFLDKGGDSAEQIRRSLISSMSNFSPVSFANNGSVSAGSVMSGVLPPTAKAPVEWASNYSFFKDAPVVPETMSGAPANEQVREDTPWLARAIGDATNSSPLQVQNAVNNLAGNVPFDITQTMSGKTPTADRFAKGVRGSSVNKIQTEFFKVYSPAKDTKEYRERQIYKAVEAGEYKKAQRIADEYNRDLDKRFDGYFKNYGAYMDSAFADQDYDPYDMINNLKINVVVSKKGKPYIKR